MSQDDELNKMFREGLSEPGHHAEYSEADWNALEKMLDEREKKRGIILWWPVATGIAAMLLLFLGWMFFKPAGTGNVKPVATVINKTTPGNGTKNDTSGQTDLNKPQIAANTIKTIHGDEAAGTVPQPVDRSNSANITKNKTKRTAIAQAKASRQGGALVGKSLIAVNKHRREGNKSTGNNSNINNEVQLGKPETETVMVANKPTDTDAGTLVKPNSIADNTPQIVKPASADTITGLKKAEIAKTAKKETKGIKTGPHVHFALTVLAAPDINSVGSFQQLQAGAGAGLLFTVGTGRVALSTGAMYAKAPYETDYSNYHIRYQFPTNPEYVNADCRILDIPVNLNYRLYGNLKNKFSVGAGLSSYLMLNEKYFYTYADPSTVGPAGYQVSNRNKHYFGVLNLDALYQRRLNSKFSLDLQPYFKLPLTNIGYGKVKLQSAGLAVGFSWNIK